MPEHSITFPYTINVYRMSERGNQICICQYDAEVEVRYRRDEDGLDAMILAFIFTDTVEDRRTGIPFKDKKRIGRDDWMFDEINASVRYDELREALEDQLGSPAVSENADHAAHHRAMAR